MHFEVLVEDASGAIMLEFFLEKILGSNGHRHTYRIHPYKGIGRLPKDLRGKADPAKRILLEQLPKLLRGYGRSLQCGDAVVIVVDLDDKVCTTFKDDLVAIWDSCNPRPNVLFRIAIEEMESWLLGDMEAVKRAYPNVKDKVLETYVQDGICGTWEKLADAIYPGGSLKLKSLGWPHIGQTKCGWAKKISPMVNADKNVSKSFQVFREGLLRLASAPMLG
ncbi:MAG: DUF4276 family protein [Desulfitobacteriaceae bacterium]|nr:DUF4276 family protein [Desulfitobacteriaceae bacterium]